VGLGHVTRDLRIARELRDQCPGLQLVWLAAEPARQALEAAGETLLPESERYASETDFAEALAGPFSLRLTRLSTVLGSPRRWKSLLRFVRGQRANVALFREATARQRFDLIVGDEAYEIMLALVQRPSLKPAPFAMILDFVGVEVTSRNPLEWLSVQFMSWLGLRLVRRLARVFDLVLFAGEEEDVADKPFGWLLPNRRHVAGKIVKYLGPVCPFDPGDFQDRAGLRRRLGYGPEPLVVAAIGGTSIGKALLELCGRAYPLLRQDLPDLRMVVVCGPRLAPESLDVPPGVECRGYVHRLWEHLAASDLAIVQGGGTTTLELTALRRPFLYFPLEGHFEQQCHVASRLERHGAGVRLHFGSATPKDLAAAVMANLGRTVDYPPIATNRARRAAVLLCDLLEGPRPRTRS
jgi:UDP:flavonoid glycosyltransferase YjiC (YdhE family)